MNVCLSSVLLMLFSLLLEGVSGVLEHNDVRLVNLPDGELCEGRLEIYHSTEFVTAWLDVCDRSFGQEEMTVVCRELGCPYSSPVKTSVDRYGERSGYIKTLAKSCSGLEAGLSRCNYTGNYMCDYQESDLVGIVCMGKGHWTGARVVLTWTLSIIAFTVLL